jgi:hypothetical protein
VIDCQPTLLPKFRKRPPLYHLLNLSWRGANLKAEPGKLRGPSGAGVEMRAVAVDRVV